MATDTISHQVNRLVIDVAGPFETFRRRYEQAAPPIDPEQIPALVGRQAAWDEVLAAAETAVPHGFLMSPHMTYSAPTGLIHEYAQVA